MMEEIKQLKAKKGGGRLEEFMREANTTPLVPSLAKAEIPKKCLIPAFECYDGSSDPAAHLRYYNRMLARWDQDDVVLYRYFRSSLKGSALSWFDNLPPNSIGSYDQLTEKFLRTYMYNKVVYAGMNKLLSLAIRYRETTWEYTDRWHKICHAIGNVDPVFSINCFKWGLDRMRPLFVEIHVSVPTTEGDLRVIIKKHARLEEIQRENPRSHDQRSHRTNSTEKASGSKRSSIERPYEDMRGRIEGPRNDDRRFEDQVYTKLNTSYARILKEIKGRENLEWPWSKGKQPPRSEKSKEYCDYHCFNGHPTEKCKNLKIMVQNLIDNGELKQYIRKEDADDRSKRSKQVQLPEGNRTLNTISCSEDAGPSLTTQIGKRLRKQFEDYCELYKIDVVEIYDHEQWMYAPITFEADDVEEDIEDHNDHLILTLPITGCNIKKILIDEGSSVSVLFYDTFKRMELNDEQPISSYHTIYGFNGAPTKPLGDIVLQINARPMKIDNRFSMVDAPSPYNAIIGRRWAHKLKGIASTYHQCLRFPSPEGIMEIKGDQVTAWECQAMQNQLNNELDEKQKSRRSRNKEAAKEKSIDLYLEGIAEKSLTKGGDVQCAEESTSTAKTTEEPTR
ncbi:uncharacterized protein LOC113276500 [Papaver somniferum]|uniref:uncharacterized protein LOC113276500 n=1 Tax=Papaver somniferum TaxID=3469 RepID=UPI000E6F8554|nr:uncharacterized protein LOC113276500 [Papaver somniferum]